MGLDACELVLAAEIGACGSMGMGFDASGSVLAVEIGACGSMESVLVGFDSCGSCGGDWCLWWISDLTISGKRRRRCLWRRYLIVTLKGRMRSYRRRKKKK